MKLRLGDDESMNNVKASLKKAGVTANVHAEATAKKTNMTSNEFE